MSEAPKDRSIPEFLTHFEAIPDPRQAAKVIYPLNEIFLLVLCAVISGADGWTSVALYGRKKLDFLRRFLPFKDGTPSHDQLGILFSRLDPEALQNSFTNWVASQGNRLNGAAALKMGKNRQIDTSSPRECAPCSRFVLKIYAKIHSVDCPGLQACLTCLKAWSRLTARRFGDPSTARRTRVRST